jgi:hypothetical protein
MDFFSGDDKNRDNLIWFYSGFCILETCRNTSGKTIKEQTNETNEKHVWNSDRDAIAQRTAQYLGSGGHVTDRAEQLHELPSEFR